MKYLPNLKLSKQDFLFSLLVICVSLGFYGFFVSNQATGINESDLIITLSAQFGVMKAPGYALLSLLNWLFISVTRTLFSPAFAANLLTAIFSSVSLGFMFLTSIVIYDYSSYKDRFILFSKKYERYIYSLIPISLIAISKIFWRYSLFAERYMLSVLLMSVILFLTTVILTSKPSKKLFPHLFLLSLILGLGISHQWIFIPVGLSLIFLLKQYLSEFSLSHLFLSVLALLGGIVVPFLLLFPALSRNIEYSYKFEPTYTGLVDFVLSKYLGDGYGVSSNINQVLESLNLESLLKNVWEIGKIIINSLSFFATGLLFIGLFHQPPANKKNIYRQIFLPIIFILLALGAAFIWTPNIDIYPEIIPQILILFPLISILLEISLYELITRLSGATEILFGSFKSRVFSLMGLFLILGLIFYGHYKTVPFNNRLVNAQVSQLILESTSPEGILTCFSQSSCYGLLYQQQIMQLNPDIIIVPYYYLPSFIVFSHDDLAYFKYNTYPNEIYDIVTWNRVDRPIYSVDMFEDYFDLFGIDYGFLSYIPYGYYSEITNSIPPKYPNIDMPLSEQVLDSRIDSWDMTLQKQKFDMVKRHLFNTSIYMKSGLRDSAVNEVNKATTMGYGLNTQLAEQIAFMRGKLESLPPNSYYELGFEADSVDKILGEVDSLIDSGAVRKATKIAHGAVTSDPRNILARLKYAQLLEVIEASDQAKIEYNNVLKLDDTNETAISRLEYQENL